MDYPNFNSLWRGVSDSPVADRDSRRLMLRVMGGIGISTLGASFCDSSAAAARQFEAHALAPLVVTIKAPWYVDFVNKRPDTQALAQSGESSTPHMRSAEASVLFAAHWTRQWLKLVVKYQQNPLRAARAIAHVNVALHDAWLRGAQSSLAPAIRELGAHRAASLVLAHFYPNETPGFFEAQYAWICAQLDPAGTSRILASDTGAPVAQAIVDRSLRDGGGRTWPIRNRPPDFPGIWQATYPMYAVNPVEAYAGEWHPWLPKAAQPYQPPTAHRPGSEAHRQETLEVLRVARELTPAQRDAAQRWHLEAGSVTPTGVWMQHALELLLRSRIQGDPFETSVAVLAAVSTAMEDALIACWAIKFRDWSERPITAIRRDLDPAFVPLLVTPGFPSYVSGHATVSAAVAKVMSGFWPLEETSLMAMASEAAMSRLWGGIHFRSDNDEGLSLGRAIGDEHLSARR